MTYADVIVDITAKALDRPFQYRVPEDLEEMAEVGSVVEAPFGPGNRLITGYIVGLSSSSTLDKEKIKDLLNIVTRSTDEEKRLIALAIWIRDRYGSTMAAALRTVLPLRRRVATKQKRVVALSVSGEKALRELESMRLKHQKARARLLEAIIAEGPLPYEVCTDKLHVTSSVVRALAQKGLLKVEHSRVYRRMALPDAFRRPDVELNEEQRVVVDSILSEWNSKIDGKYLIQGVTGSGKTEVYIELIAHAVAEGKQAIVLIPEIALTYQTLMRFYHRFGGRVSVIHSKMSAGEKQDQFDRARTGDLDIIIGPRSALFSPFPRLGIIVIDEEHEESYRSGQSPRYHAREVAFQRGKMEGAKIVLGSATPSLEASWAARKGEIRLLKLSRRASAHSLPIVKIIDMRKETGKSGSSLISEHMCLCIGETLSRGGQAMLFLNRRGYAGFVMCRSCGDVIKCPHCDVSLTLHEGNILKCHYCGFEMPMTGRCPKCGSRFIRTFKAGTEQAEREIRILFPDAVVLRMDRDSISGRDGQLKVLSSFASHEADILIGTQMIVKGHDFPDVTLVGCLCADLSLNIPSYRACERTFQLLTQAAGRAGRAGKEGLVLIQTYQKEHYAIRCAAKQDYDSFYEQEIRYRRLMGYPPVGGLLTLHMSSLNHSQLQKAADHIRKFLEKILSHTSVRILGPVDEPVAKIADIWYMALYLKGGSFSLLHAARERLEKYVGLNKGFIGIEIQFDSDFTSI